MALDFPSSPTNGQKYPASPIIGIPTYTWDGEKWTTVGGSMGTLDPATAMPLQDATPGVVGASIKYAREDHVHPINTSIIPVAATAAEYIANSAPSKMLTSGATWTAASRILLGPISNITIDFSAGLDFVVLINSATCTMNNPTNLKGGQKGIISLAQDGSGGRAITTWGSFWRFPGGVKPVLTATAGAFDTISYVVMDGGNVYCTFAADFK